MAETARRKGLEIKPFAGGQMRDLPCDTIDERSSLAELDQGYRGLELVAILSGQNA